MSEVVLELEGRWEDISPHTAGLEGTYIRLTVLERGHDDARDAAFYTGRMQRFLDDLESRREEMPLTSGDATQALLREARDGGMYGADSDD